MARGQGALAVARPGNAGVMLAIRDATAADAAAMAGLLAELGYPRLPSNCRRLHRFEGESHGRVLVAVSTTSFERSRRWRSPTRFTSATGRPSISVRGVPQRPPPGPWTAVAGGGGGGRAGRGCGQVVVTSAEHRADAHAFYPAAGWGLTGRRFGKTIDRFAPCRQLPRSRDGSSSPSRTSLTRRSGRRCWPCGIATTRWRPASAPPHAGVPFRGSDLRSGPRGAPPAACIPGPCLRRHARRDHRARE